MRDDPLGFKITTILHILNTLPSMFRPLQPAIQPHPNSPPFSTAQQQYTTMASLFASRKRDREEEEDELQLYAPDTKVSAVNGPHQHRVADPGQ